MQFLVGNFEAYPAVKQRLANGQFARNPCQTDMVSPFAPATPCFDVSNVSAVFSPNLRQDCRAGASAQSGGLSAHSPEE